MKKIAKRFELLECIRKSIQIMCMIMFMTVYSSTVVFSSNTYSQTSDNSVIDQTQRKIISGKVTDVNGLSLHGVSVIVNGTTIGTVTNAEGEFSLSIPIDAEMLTFSFLGMKSVEIVIGDRTNFVVVMEEDTIALEEVIAIGYGNVRKKDLTGAVGTVEGARISERKSMQISTALQGAMPGLMVTRSSGQPGATSTIRVRGITTIGDTNPLVLVDGMQVSDVNQVNPEDVESISVLKDAASAAIYGSRAAAGVILITTKRAKSGELELDYSYQYGIEKPTDFPTYAGPELYMTRMNEMQWNTNNNSGIEDPLYAQDHIDNYRALNDENPDRYPITDYYREFFN